MPKTIKYEDAFEINITNALSSQLIEAFSRLYPVLLHPKRIGNVNQRKGIYQLYLRRDLVYVGSAENENLPQRLNDHYEKIKGRKNININHMRFKCLYVHPNWTSLSPERTLINYYKANNNGLSAWNGLSFGPHDPGRNRELTHKHPQNFDATYPIKEDLICSGIAGTPKIWQVLDLLVTLKKQLPYLFRYQTQALANNRFAHYTIGHPDFTNVTVTLPGPNLTAIEILKFITMQLPGWQSWCFPSHMILYKESAKPPNYQYGSLIHRQP